MRTASVTDTMRETAALVRARKQHGLTVKALAEAKGISCAAASWRLRDARLAGLKVGSYGRGRNAKWVADEYSDTFLARRDAAYAKRQKVAKRRWWKMNAAVQVKQKVVSVNSARKIKIVAPASIFHLAELMAA